METFDHEIFFDGKVADFECDVVVLWIGVLGDSLRFEIAWPHYDDASRSRIDKAKANFLNKTPRLRLAATPEITTTFCMSSNKQALLHRRAYGMGIEQSGLFHLPARSIQWLWMLNGASVHYYIYDSPFLVHWLTG